MIKTKKLLSLLLLICMLFSFIACDKDESADTKDPVEEETSGDATYTVSVHTPAGLAVTGVLVYVHNNENEFDPVGMPISTDKNGVASFTLPADGAYSVQLVNLPNRYICTEGAGSYGRYLFTEGRADITVDYNPDYHPEVYKVGDKLADFTVTDVYGNTHTLSALLGTKKMVMLNIWFTGCGPCAAEFPVINSAYNNFASDVEILAISDYYTDSVEKVKNYPANKGLTIDFPLVYDRTVFSPPDFGSGYYPTTVIIDRYGVICMIEIGSVTSSDLWNNTFAYFTSDNYKQCLFDSMSDIPDQN